MRVYERKRHSFPTHLPNIRTLLLMRIDMFRKIDDARYKQ